MHVAVERVFAVDRERLLHERKCQDLALAHLEPMHAGAMFESVGGNLVVEVIDEDEDVEEQHFERHGSGVGGSGGHGKRAVGSSSVQAFVASAVPPSFA